MPIYRNWIKSLRFDQHLYYPLLCLGMDALYFHWGCDQTIALDQTIRNAIGLPYRATAGQVVRLAGLERSAAQRIGDRLRPGQRLMMRIGMASPLDMEKNNCRISEDALSAISSSAGIAV